MQIELKEEGTALPVVYLVRSKHAEANVIIRSFRHGLLEEVHKSNPRLRRGALFSKFEGDMCQRVIQVHAHAIHVFFQDVDAALVEAPHRKHLDVGVLGVPDRALEMERLIDFGVVGIYTNRPDMLFDLLRTGTI